MNKNGKERWFLRLLIGVSLLMYAVMAPTHVYAETTGDLSVSISSSRDEYVAGDIAEFTVVIENISAALVEDAHYSISLPQGVEVLDGCRVEGPVGDISPGETKSVEIRARVSGAPSGQSDENIAATGDVAGVVAACFGIIGGLIFVAGCLARKSRNRAAILSVVGIVLCLGMFPANNAFAQGTESQSVIATKSVDINGKSRQVSATISYVLAGEPSTRPDATLTRAEFISRLLSATRSELLEDVKSPFVDIADHELAEEIETAYAYGIVPEVGQQFEPDAVATREFAYSVGVLAAGIDYEGKDLNCIDADECDYPEYMAAAVESGLVELRDGLLKAKSPFDRADFDKLLDAVVTFGTAESGGQGDGDVIAETEYRSDVTVIKGYEEDGESYRFESEKRIQVGDRIALEPLGDSQMGAAGTVTSVYDRDGQTVVTIEQAQLLEEIYKTVRVDFEDLLVDFSDAEWANGVEVVAETETLAARDRTDLGKIKLSIEWPGHESGFNVKASISTTPYIESDVDWRGLFGGFRKLELGVGAETELESGIVAEVQRDVTIRLTKKPIVINVAGPIFVQFNLNLEVSAEGSAQLSATMDNSFGFRLNNGKVGPYGKSDIDSQFELEAKAKAGLGPSANLTVGSIDVADIKVSAGLEGKGSLVPRPTGMLCNDVSLFAFAEIVAGDESKPMQWIDADFTVELWNEDSSPYRKKLHFEDGESVPACTYEADDEEDNPSQVDSDFIWEDLEDGRWIVDYVGTAASVVIPVEIDGEPVVGVGFNETGMQRVRSISFADGSEVKHISYGALAEGIVLETLDLENASHLKGIALMGTEIKSLDLSGLSELESFYSNGLSLERLILSRNDSLTSFWYVGSGRNLVEQIAFSEAPSLLDLEVDADGLASIDVSQNKELQALTVTGMSLTHLDLSNNQALVSLVIQDTAVKTLDVSNHDRLEQLDCSNCDLTQLNIDNTPNLSYLNCSGNQISDLGPVLSHPHFDPDTWLTEQS